MGGILFFLGACVCVLFWMSTWEFPESKTEAAAAAAAAESEGRVQKERVTFGDFVASVIQLPLLLMLMISPFYFIFKLIF